MIDILEIADAVGQLGSLAGPVELGSIEVSFDTSGNVVLGTETGAAVDPLDALGGFGDALEGALFGTGEFESYISVPLFENPLQTVAQLLFNGAGTDPVVLIEMDLPELTFGARAEIFFPVGPVKLFIEGNFSASTDFTLGYDTFGFQSGADFLQGFFVEPSNPGDPFAELSLGLRAGGGVGVVIGSVEASGGGTGTIEFNLATGDGQRTRLSDLTAFPCIFDSISGRITADVTIEVSVGIKPLKFTERIVIGEITLTNFNFDPACAGPHGGPAQVFEAGLALPLGDVLALKPGLWARSRQDTAISTGSIVRTTTA